MEIRRKCVAATRIGNDNFGMMRSLLMTGLMILVAARICISAEIRSDVEYGNVDGESLKLDARIPDGEGPFPISIFIHGGGWGGGDKAVVHVPPTKPLTDANFTWFTIDYRLAPKLSLARLQRRRSHRHPLGEGACGRA